MKLAYVGWVGFGNLGDDAIAEAVLPPLEPEEVVYAAHGLRDVPKVIGAGTRHRHLLLGGGTAIGRRNWRVIINLAGAAQAWRRPWFMIGAGVEDPGFGGKNSFSGNDELARWTRTLARFDHVTVRGPRSAELLGDVGVDAAVVGDPALLLSPPSPPAGDQTGALGIALGFGDDLWGHAQQRVLDAVATTAQDHARAGGTVRLLVMNDEDELAAAHVSAAVAAAVPGAATTHRVRTSAEFFGALYGCDVFIAQRLHGAVLAAAGGVPVVALEYQPKCRDFMASIAQTDLCLRCDTVTAATVRDALGTVSSNWLGRRGDVALRVAKLRTLLSAELERIRIVADPHSPRAAVWKEASSAGPRTSDRVLR